MAVKKAQMMPTFVYEGIDRKGAKLKGEIPARNMALAKVTLRKQGITIKTIRQKKKNILEGLMKKRGVNLRHHHFHASTCHNDESRGAFGTKL